MNKTKVSNLCSNRGNKIPNQFLIRTENGSYFQSYKSIIVFIDNTGQVWLDPVYWDYSNTTGKYRNIFLGETKKETQSKLESGIYKFKNLNNK